MKKKLVGLMIVLTMILSVIIPTVYAANEDVTLEEAENNVCKIELGNNGELVKKLIKVDNDNKEAILQVDVTNLKNEETLIEESEIILVIDNSKSMSDNTLSSGTTRKEAVFGAAKELAKSIITAQSNTKIGVVSFSTNSDAEKEGTLEDAKLMIKPTNKIADVENAIDSIETTGARTNIDAGLQIARDNFTTGSKLNQYLILLTDGVPNTAVGGPKATYSGETTTKTKATLKSVIDKGINIVTVMTGVDSTYQPDPTGATSSEAAGKTYAELAEEVFGTESKPNYGKFYYVTDDKATETITKTVYSDVVIVKKNEIKNITVIDYFPEDIIANYDYEIVSKANIGEVSATVDTSNNSIIWTIETLKAGETATFQYKLKLKEKYDEKILNVIMPTNQKVDVNYIGTDETEHQETSDVSPKIVLKGDKTIAPTPIPQTGDMVFYIALAVLVITIATSVYVYNYKKIR